MISNFRKRYYICALIFKLSKMKHNVKFYFLALFLMFIGLQQSMAQQKEYIPLVPLEENTQKLYFYRLALPVEKGYYATFFNNDEKKVFEFWNNIEIYLNNIFIRDLGIKFQVIKDKKLIVTNATVIPSSFSASAIVKT